MDVDGLIRAHRQSWQRLEAATARGPKALARQGGERIDEVVRLYLLTSAHLAELRTRSHDRELERYLSHVVATAHGAIYGSRPRTVRGLLATFGERYRGALGRTRLHVAVAGLLLLGTCVAVGMWAWASPEAQAGLVPGYVSTLAEQGGSLRDPSAGLSTAIFLNNVRVAMLAFALGITLGLGTVWVLVTNGVLIGGLAGTAVAVGGGQRFFSLVLPHGFLELLAIAIAAGAGLRMGWSVIEPGDRTRKQALALAGRDAALVVVGVVPAFALAGAIEGLLTGVTGVPVAEIVGGAGVAAAYAWFVLVAPASRERDEPTGAVTGTRPA
ncbi:MAG TPA: stage II sporulation protein M [Nitriliruptorales bacterium]